MKYVKVIILLILCFPSIGKSQSNLLISEKVIELFDDVNFYLNDTNVIIYPYVTNQICVDVSKLVLKKYEFSVDQICNHSKDSFSLVGNRCFEVIESDSILKYHNVGLETKNGVIIFEPFQYYVKQKYKKEMVRYFSVPVFSKSGNYAIVKYIDRCGEDCGDGAVFILEKQKAKWIVIDTLVYIMI